MRLIEVHISQEKAGEGQICPERPREDQRTPWKDNGSKGGRPGMPR